MLGIDFSKIESKSIETNKSRIVTELEQRQRKVYYLQRLWSVLSYFPFASEERPRYFCDGVRLNDANRDATTAVRHDTQTDFLYPGYERWL